MFVAELLGKIKNLLNPALLEISEHDICIIYINVFSKKMYIYTYIYIYIYIYTNM